MPLINQKHKFLNLLFLLYPLIICMFLQSPSFAQESPSMLVRFDDIGMCHTVNAAIDKVLEVGFPVSTSVMFACPWYKHAVEILKKYDHLSVGIHLTLNSEWKNYRWGPVSGVRSVPSLVDNDGYFFPSRATLFANNPKTEEVEIELRAQIERAMNSGLRIDYLDYHMGAAIQTLELRQLVEELAQEFGLGIAQYFGENYSSITYRVQIGSKTDSLVKRIEELKPGEIGLQVVHVGMDTPEMSALQDLNLFGPKDMSKQRADELSTILSPKFLKSIKDNNITLITYKDLVKQNGIKNMKRPQSFK